MGFCPFEANWSKALHCPPFAPAGKYKPGGAKPFGPRQPLFNDSRLREVAPLISAMVRCGFRVLVDSWLG
jgi:hypothetical protein